MIINLATEWALLAVTPLWFHQVPGLAFAFCFGACVGSFINVVAYRLPAGISIVTPPSRCPTCGWRLTWRENFPILGWFLLRARCSKCGVRISAQYMLIESLMAFLFLLLTILHFVVLPATPWWGDIAGPWWYFNGVKTLPSFIAVLVLIGCLVGMTIIDARTFTIPMQLPLTATLVAFAAAIVQPHLPVQPRAGQPWPIPLPGWQALLTCGGAMTGLLLSILLTQLGALRRSFSDYEQFLKEGEQLAEYPHGRREMLVELLFLAPAIVLGVAGYMIGGSLLSAAGTPPLWLSAVGGVAMGYLVGGGLVWAIRILGTLGFGREAMGMGDVHLLAAVGAVVGWRDPIFIFFAAAFVGLAWVVISWVLQRWFNLRNVQRQLPYGPHLAVATLLVMLLRPAIYETIWPYLENAWGQLFP